MNSESRPDWLVLLGLILRGSPSLPQAACRDCPEPFTSNRRDDIALAKSICQSCIEQPKCDAWARQQKRGDIVGVLGGVRYPVPKKKPGRPRKKAA